MIIGMLNTIMIIITMGYLVQRRFIVLPTTVTLGSGSGSGTKSTGGSGLPSYFKRLAKSCYNHYNRKIICSAWN
jgi:hypothetical protein